MKKFIKIIIVLVVVLTILVGGFLFSPLLSMSAKKSIEHFGSKILKTEVTVDGVGINVLAGEISISGLTVANPEGFDEPYAFKLGEVSVDADMKSLKSDTIIISSILIDAPEIVLEDMGKNIDALLNNIDKSEKTAEDSVEKGDPAKKVVIADLILQNALVKVKKGIDIDLRIPTIHLENLGSEDNAASISDVLSKLMRSITKESLKAMADTGKESLKKSFKTLFN